MKTFIKVLDFILAISFFLMANLEFWGTIFIVFVGFSQPHLLEYPLHLAITLLFSLFLMYTAVLFIRKSKLTYPLASGVMVTMLVEVSVYRFFFINNRFFDSGDFFNVLFFGTPLLVTGVAWFLSKRNKIV